MKEFEELLEQMQDTYEKKNADYGDSFSQSISKWGYTAALVRMDDKMNRLNSLLCRNTAQKVKDESALDTAMDLANYAVMLAMEIKRRSNG